MAGSYRHITNEENEFIGIVHLDNLGDCLEALEECYQLIQILAKGSKKRIAKAHKQYVARKNPEYANTMNHKDYFKK